MSRAVSRAAARARARARRRGAWRRAGRASETGRAAGAARPSAAAHLIRYRFRTHLAVMCDVTHWRPRQAESAPVAGRGARATRQRVQCGHCVRPPRSALLRRVQNGQVKQVLSFAACGRPKTHLRRLRRHAQRVVRRRRDREQSYEYLGQAAHRFEPRQHLDLHVHLLGTEFWAASAPRQTSAMPPARERARGLKASGMAHQ